MTANRATVERYFEGFRKSDHDIVLACLADDVEWVLPGGFHVTGKAAFDKEIQNDAFVGSPEIDITRTLEADDVVVVEGRVKTERRSGGFLYLAFCDVFEMRDGLIRRLISYLMEVKA